MFTISEQEKNGENFKKRNNPAACQWHIQIIYGDFFPCKISSSPIGSNRTINYFRHNPRIMIEYGYEFHPKRLKQCKVTRAQHLMIVSSNIVR